MGFAFLAFALGFGNAKLRTEMARAPVPAQELRYAPVSGWVEAHELRDKGLVALYEWMSGHERDGLGDVSPVWRSLRKGWLLLLRGADHAGGEHGHRALCRLSFPPHDSLRPHRQSDCRSSGQPALMPMALISLIAMPFGLEAWPLKAMSAGIEFVVATSSGWRPGRGLSRYCHRSRGRRWYLWCWGACG